LLFPPSWERSQRTFVSNQNGRGLPFSTPVSISAVPSYPPGLRRFLPFRRIQPGEILSRTFQNFSRPVIDSSWLPFSTLPLGSLSAVRPARDEGLSLFRFRTSPVRNPGENAKSSLDLAPRPFLDPSHFSGRTPETYRCPAQSHPCLSRDSGLSFATIPSRPDDRFFCAGVRLHFPGFSGMHVKKKSLANVPFNRRCACCLRFSFLFPPHLPVVAPRVLAPKSFLRFCGRFEGLFCYADLLDAFYDCAPVSGTRPFEKSPNRGPPRTRFKFS